MTFLIQIADAEAVRKEQINALELKAAGLAASLARHASVQVDGLILRTIQENQERVASLGVAGLRPLKARLLALKAETADATAKAFYEDVEWLHRETIFERTYAANKLGMDGYLPDHARILRAYLTRFSTEMAKLQLNTPASFFSGEAPKPLKEEAEAYLKQVGPLVRTLSQLKDLRAKNLAKTALDYWNQA